MKYLFEIMLSDFWKFVGGMLIMSMVGTFFLVLFNRFFRHWNIRKHGYPPPHCDADGDFINSEKDK